VGGEGVEVVAEGGVVMKTASTTPSTSGRPWVKRSEGWKSRGMWVRAPEVMRVVRL
jgi:hypothetical protein